MCPQFGCNAMATAISLHFGSLMWKRKILYGHSFTNWRFAIARRMGGWCPEMLWRYPRCSFYVSFCASFDIYRAVLNILIKPPPCWLQYLATNCWLPWYWGSRYLIWGLPANDSYFHLRTPGSRRSCRRFLHRKRRSCQRDRLDFGSSKPPAQFRQIQNKLGITRVFLFDSILLISFP